MRRRPPRSTRTDTLFPYTTLFRSGEERLVLLLRARLQDELAHPLGRAHDIGRAHRLVGADQDETPDAHRLGGKRAVKGAEDIVAHARDRIALDQRSEEHTSELQSLMRSSYAVFCMQQKHNVPPSTN